MSGTASASLCDPNGRGVNDVVYNPASRQLAVGNSGRSIFLWNATTQALVPTLTAPGEHGRVNRVTFSRDGTLPAAADGDGDDHAYQSRNRQP